MKILGIDTSACAAGVGIVCDGRIAADFFLNAALTHSQTLMPMVEEALKLARLAPANIDLFAVANGPGSFTGVRIGVSAVKGMAGALDKPCAPVSTLLGLAYNLIGFDGVIACPVMDARRSQVYTAFFGIENGEINRQCEDRAISIAQLAEEISSVGKTVILVGDGAELCYNQMSGLSNIKLAPENLRFQKGGSVALAAVGAEPISAAELVPAYLRLPQAERELKLKV